MYGTFQFEVMPFGLMNSEATFQRIIDRIVANVESVMCYADDVVIHSATKEEQIGNHETVKKFFKEHGLRLRLKKRFFMQPSNELLGHFIDKDGAKWLT